MMNLYFDIIIECYWTPLVEKRPFYFLFKSALTQYLWAAAIRSADFSIEPRIFHHKIFRSRIMAKRYIHIDPL